MSKNSYYKGQKVRIKVTFTDTTSGNLADPDVVRCLYVNPAGTLVTLVYLTDGALVRDSTGAYHVDISATLHGDWFYRFESTGNGQAATEASFYIDDGHF